MENRKYIAPEIVQINLDNEISLVLNSMDDFPPEGPGEGLLGHMAPDYFGKEPLL